MKISHAHIKGDGAFLTTKIIVYMPEDEDGKMNHFWNSALNSPCLFLTGEAILLLLFKFCQMPLSHSVSPTSSLKNLFSCPNYQSATFTWVCCKKLPKAICNLLCTWTLQNVGLTILRFYWKATRTVMKCHGAQQIPQIHPGTPICI